MKVPTNVGTFLIFMRYGKINLDNIISTIKIKI